MAIISLKPFTAVRGVLSSCPALSKNSLRVFSAFFIAVTSDKTTATNPFSRFLTETIYVLPSDGENSKLSSVWL